MMIKGQRVVCINDRFDIPVAELYVALPVRNSTYVIRDVMIGRKLNQPDDTDEVEVCVLLEGLHNPLVPQADGSFIERAFLAERFAPLEEVTEEAEETNIAYA